MPDPAPVPMPTQLVGRAVALVRDAGGDADALIRAHDLPLTVETDPFVLLPVPRLRAVLDDAERAAGDPALGLNIARWRDDGNVVAFACRGAPDLRSALTRCLRLITSLNPQLLVKFEEQGGHGEIDMRLVGEPLGLGRHGNEYWVACLLLQARRLSGEPRAPERIWFAHPAPRDRADLIRVLGTSRVTFGAGSNGMAVSTRVLDTPLRTADPSLVALCDRYAQAMLARHGEEGPFVSRVRQAIVDQLPHGAPTLESVARACGVSVRTLQRRLEESGQSFRAVRDGVRTDVSAMYVDDKELSLDQVATLLGFAQASGLVRAYRRWTGKTPRDRGPAAEG
jgi:AraC-like DNA-binding protein